MASNERPKGSNASGSLLRLQRRKSNFVTCRASGADHPEDDRMMSFKGRRLKRFRSRSPGVPSGPHNDDAAAALKKRLLERSERDDRAAAAEAAAVTRLEAALEDAEAIAEVHHYDILLKIVLINRTPKTIQNINCELLTRGNVEVVEKPGSLTLRAGAS